MILIALILLTSCSTERPTKVKQDEDCWSYIRNAVKFRADKNYPAALSEIEKHNSCDLKAGSDSRMSYFYHLGWTYYEMGEYDRAIAAFTEGLKTQPDYLHAYVRRGLAFEKIGNFKSANNDFSRAYKLGMEGDSQKFLEYLEKNPEIKAKLIK